MSGPFEYTSVIYAVVIGLGVTNVLVALADTVKYRRRVRYFWVHSVWCLYLLVGLLGLWWGVWQIQSQIESMSLFEFFLTFQWAVFLFFCSRLLSIEQPREQVLDMEQAFEDVRPILFAAIVAPVIIFNGWVLYSGLYELDLAGVLSKILMLSICTVGFFFSGRRIQQGCAMGLLITQIIEEAYQQPIVSGVSPLAGF